MNQETAVSPEPPQEAAFPRTQQGKRSLPPKVNQGALDRQRRDFRRYQRKRLDSLMRTYKINKRREDQDYFASQEELDALFKDGLARSMFGALPRDPQGDLLALPTSDGLRDYLLKQKKTRHQLLETLLPQDCRPESRDRVCSLSIMHGIQLKEISKHNESREKQVRKFEALVSPQKDLRISEVQQEVSEVLPGIRNFSRNANFLTDTSSQKLTTVFQSKTKMS